MTTAPENDDAPGTAAVVYRYHIAGPLPDEVAAEIRRAHILRNKLTELARAADEEIAGIYAALPAVAEAQARAGELAARVKDLREQIRARKSAGRTRRPDPDLTAALAAARAGLAAARDAARDAKTAEREKARPAVTAATIRLHARIKDLYPQAMTGDLFTSDPVLGDDAPGGMYWATFNLVRAQQITARKRVLSLRAQRRPAELRFRRWDGSGTIAVQLQRQAADPPRTPEILADAMAGPWRNVALLVADGEGKQRGELRFRLGSGAAARHVTVPLVMHRPLPADADVCQVQVTWGGRRYRDGRRADAAVAITCKIPAPELREGDAAAAVHCGWRSLPDGSLRVAVIRAPGAPPQQHWVHRKTGERQPAVRSYGSWHEVVIPPGVRDLAAHARSLESIRGREMERVRKAVAEAIAGDPVLKVAVDPDGTLSRWRSPGRFRRALADCEAAREPDLVLAGLLREWSRQDRHLAEWAQAERDRVSRWRGNLYRVVAAWVTAEAAAVVVDGWEAVRRRPGDGEEDTRQMEAARANAVLASPGELRHAVSIAAGRRGAAVAGAPEGLGAVHHGCAASPPGVLPADERAEDVMVACRGCGLRVDQDANVLRGMLP